METVQYLKKEIEANKTQSEGMQEMESQELQIKVHHQQNAKDGR